MEVRFRLETESRLHELVRKTGRPAAEARDILDARYDDIKSGRVVPLDGEEAMARLRRKSEERRARS